MLAIVTIRSALLGANVAVTVFAESIVTVQLVPLQAPPQNMKSEPAAGLAVSVTGDPAGNDAAHAGGRFIPGCDAVTVQLPAPSICTVLPAIEQGPLALKVTGRPEVAVALRLTGTSPKVLLASGPKLIVWAAGVMANVRATGGAAR